MSAVAPQNVEAEEQVLGAMLLAPSAVDAVREVLGDGGAAFYRPSHQTVYCAALALRDRGEPVDALTLLAELETTGQLEQAGGRSRVHELAKLVPAASNAGHYARIVREVAQRRREFLLSVELGAASQNGGLAGNAELREGLAAALASDERGTRGEPHSWRPVALSGLERKPEPPTIAGIAYPGRRHVWSGEPESLKSFAGSILCVEEIRVGNSVVYVDLENGPEMTLERLHQLGLDENEIAERFVYLRPEEPLTDPAVRADVEALVAERRPSLVVFDSYVGMLALHGADDWRASEIERYDRGVVELFRSHGAATIHLDHLVKDRERRGRYSIGSERKLGAADVHLGFELVEPFGRGRTGRARIVVHKDRPGHLPRPHAAVIELASDAQTGSISWTIQPAEQRAVEATPQPFRPTALMERVSRHLEQRPEPVSRADVETAIRGKAKYVRQAMECLVADGYAAEEKGARGARLLRSLKAFREHDLVPTSSRAEAGDLVPTSSPPEPLNRAESATSSHLVPTPSPGRDDVPRPAKDAPLQGRPRERDEVDAPTTGASGEPLHPGDHGYLETLELLRDHVTDRERGDLRLLHLHLVRLNPDENACGECDDLERTFTDSLGMMTATNLASRTPSASSPSGLSSVEQMPREGSR